MYTSTLKRLITSQLDCFWLPCRRPCLLRRFTIHAQISHSHNPAAMLNRCLLYAKYRRYASDWVSEKRQYLSIWHSSPRCAFALSQLCSYRPRCVQQIWKLALLLRYRVWVRNSYCGKSSWPCDRLRPRPQRVLISLRSSLWGSTSIKYST